MDSSPLLPHLVRRVVLVGRHGADPGAYRERGAPVSLGRPNTMHTIDATAVTAATAAHVATIPFDTGASP